MTFRPCRAHKCHGFAKHAAAFCSHHWDRLPPAYTQAIVTAYSIAGGALQCNGNGEWLVCIQAAFKWLLDDDRAKREAPPPLPTIRRVVADTGPDGPAVGIHYWHLGRYGFIPPPPFTGSGRCWWCGLTGISVYPPLCVSCATLLWGPDIFRPVALAARGIKAGVRAR